MKINRIKNIDDIKINFEDFPTKSNIVLVMGLSGSGKSYLSNQLAEKHKATTFQLEWLIHSKHTSEECKYILDTFLQQHPEIIENVDNKWNNCKSEDQNDLLKEYINKFFLHFLEMRDPNKLYVVESLQLFTLIDFELIKDYPIIVKGTSSFKSLKQRLKRDLAKPKNKKISAKIKYFFKALNQSRLYQFKHRKVLNKFLKRHNEYTKNKTVT